eukprot:16987-Heterococcus_DN1.PRE.2
MQEIQNQQQLRLCEQQRRCFKHQLCIESLCLLQALSSSTCNHYPLITSARADDSSIASKVAAVSLAVCYNCLLLQNCIYCEPLATYKNYNTKAQARGQRHVREMLLSALEYWTASFAALRTVLQTVLHERKSPQLLQQQLCSAYSAAAASAVSVLLAELLR